MDLGEKVEAEIEKRFAESDRDAVRMLLSGYENEYVRLCILRLSRGKVKRVEDLVEAARRDYRDVIAWASQPIRTYIVGLLRKGPAWSDDDENGRTHLSGKLLQQWKASSQICVGGWFIDFGEFRGLYIFTVDSIDEAHALAVQDPAIQSGKLVFEFHPWLAPDGVKVSRSDEL